MTLAASGLRQRDGVSCGPAVAVLAGALLDPSYAEAADAAWFDAEQVRVHAAANRIWPRALGMTPWAVAATISTHGARHGVRYGWRLRRPHDDLADVLRAVRAHWPVAMLVGNPVPRHWVLIVDVSGDTLQCYEPSSGGVRPVSTAAVRGAGLAADLGFPRAVAFVLPCRRLPSPTPPFEHMIERWARCSRSATTVSRCKRRSAGWTRRPRC